MKSIKVYKYFIISQNTIILYFVNSVYFIYFVYFVNSVPFSHRWDCCAIARVWNIVRNTCMYLRLFIGVSKTLCKHCDALDSTPCLCDQHLSQLCSQMLSSQNNCLCNNCLRAAVSCFVSEPEHTVGLAWQYTKYKLYKLYKFTNYTNYTK